MPLFEYSCQQCAHQFETLVRGSDTPQCPACHATALTRRSSVFAARASGQGQAALEASAPGSCGRCGDPRGPGACSMN